VGDDFSSEAVALATGKAENVVEAEGWTMKGVLPFVNDVREGKLQPKKISGAKLLPEEERPAALVDLLLGLPGTREEMDALNAFLAEHGSRVVVRKP